ncbi:MAG: EAL domain-containing protein, partial [Lachnospiraceae bacterium]|nr:EAL domain-containing protein [Lachnospiraceae bacterium]
AYDSVDELKNFAQSVVDIVKLPFDLEGETAHVSASIGVALFPEHGLSINELIKNADLAMYSAKTSGNNAYRFFDSFMDYDFSRKNELNDILSSVIDKKEVYLLYQPQVNMITGEITGYEALMRINSELLGFVSPEEFIPIAEDNGMINELGEWALYEACMFNNTIIKNGYGPFKVSVNVSTSQLKKDNFIDIIKSIPAKTGMSLKYLEIEITESVLMQSFEHNLKLINQIKELGVAIALDDFGTGYSSFNYLTQLPIDTLKIDKSFIDDICNNENDKYIANTIISLAHQMNIAVVAEGVESQDQLEILQDQLCDTLQGYLFSKPITASELAKIITINKTLK